MDKAKAAYDEGLAMGHYQADSMYRNNVKEMNQKMGYHDMSDKANCHKGYSCKKNGKMK